MVLLPVIEVMVGIAVLMHPECEQQCLKGPKAVLERAYQPPQNMVVMAC